MTLFVKVKIHSCLKICTSQLARMFHLKVALCLFLLSSAAFAQSELAIESNDVQNKQEKESSSQESEAQQNNNTLNDSALDSVQQSLAESVTATAAWLDAFFADPEYPDTQVDVRLNLRQYFTKQESLPIEFKTRVDGRVKLPNISRKLSLVFSGNDDDDESAESLDDGLRQTDDNPNLGLEVLNQRKPGDSERLKIGYRFGESSYYVGGRVRRATTIAEDWQVRASQRLRWYHQFGWESQTFFEIDYLKKKHRFFQYRISTLWREDKRPEIGTETNSTFSYVHLIDEQSAWRVSWSSDYHTEPQSRWIASQLGIGYRQAFYRDWLRVELQPYVRWEEANAWQPDYGFVLLFNALIEQ